MSALKAIGVIGAGTMGNGIAQVFAQKGYQVTLVEANDALLLRGLGLIEKSLGRLEKKGKLAPETIQSVMGRIHGTVALSDVASADLIIEAVTEEEGAKRALWREIDRIAKKEAIFASNTSSISITKLAAWTSRPERFIGMHFMNPVPMMKLVEVIRGLDTSEETLRLTCELARELDKVPVEANDFPGFVANRILMPMINEAVYALMEGVATAQNIDEIMKLGMAHPMGPLRLADFIGLDVCLSILEVMHRELGDPKYRPCPLLRKMVASGHLGDKTGRGFYTQQA
ncbi:MAG: 3-hydroxybutyryl-CoA dehydrogenase [Planctomycetes bacterium]|nr:3-hydroxybutyryl-CoA dehydrogenase [Planctomycetota bacterium]